MLPSKLLLLNWLRGETREEKGGWDSMEPAGAPPPSKAEFVRRREGETDWDPPIGVGGPDGTMFHPN